jgi:hypothetical protein
VAAAHAEPSVRAIQAEATYRRGELTGLVQELKLRLRPERHLVGIAITALATGAAIAAAVALRRRRAQREASFLARSRRIRAAVGRLMEQPERVAVQPTTTQRVLESAASAAAVYLINAALERIGRGVRSL